MNDRQMKQEAMEQVHILQSHGVTVSVKTLQGDVMRALKLTQEDYGQFVRCLQELQNEGMLEVYVDVISDDRQPLRVTSRVLLTSVGEGYVKQVREWRRQVSNMKLTRGQRAIVVALHALGAEPDDGTVGTLLERMQHRRSYFGTLVVELIRMGLLSGTRAGRKPVLLHTVRLTEQGHYWCELYAARVEAKKGQA